MGGRRLSIPAPRAGRLPLADDDLSDERDDGADQQERYRSDPAPKQRQEGTSPKGDRQQIG